MVPQKEKTLCNREWALLSAMTNKFREGWRASFSEALAINSESCWAEEKKKGGIFVECCEKGRQLIRYLSGDTLLSVYQVKTKKKKMIMYSFAS